MWNILLSIRYFLARRREGMISFISAASVLGVAIGVASLIIVLSVMNGFDREVREKIIGTYAHFTITGEGGIAKPDEFARRIGALPGVESAAPFVTGQAVLVVNGQLTGVLVKGIEPEKERKVTDIVSFIERGSDKPLAAGSIVPGKELARLYGIADGSEAELVVPRTMREIRKEKFRSSGLFSSGRYDYDANLVIMGFKDAQTLFGMEGLASGVAVRVSDGDSLEAAKERLSASLGPGYVVRSWMDLDRNLVSALALEKKMMFITLGIIVMVACFNITSSLIMMVMEKTRDIGILKAIGATSFGVSGVFLFEGFITGALGTSLGAVAGVFIAERVNAITSFIKQTTGYEMFPRDVYYFTALPVDIKPADISAIIGISMILALLAGIYPAWRASRLDPVEAIRYE